MSKYGYLEGFQRVNQTLEPYTVDSRYLDLAYLE